MKQEILVGWHFINNDLTLQRPFNNKTVKVYPGLTLKTNPNELELCSNGLHASINILDAVEYAYSWKVCRIISTGKFVYGDNKYASTQRKVLYS